MAENFIYKLQIDFSMLPNGMQRDAPPKWRAPSPPITIEIITVFAAFGQSSPNGSPIERRLQRASASKPQT